MSLKKISLLMALVLLLTAVFTACAPANNTTENAETETEAEVEEVEEEALIGEGHLFCQVTDVGGIDDKSFNATAWKGVLDAENDFGITAKYLESNQASDYEVNINAFIEEGCDVIFPVGYMLEDAAKAAAEANPDLHFALIDIPSSYENMAGSLYNIEQATYLIGYLAAGMTETGIIGTYVGILFPATQAYADGYYLGAMKYNEVHGTDVQVLGWDPATGIALEAGNFESTDDGRRLGETLLDEGADIIMPIAGPVGAGTLALLAERETGMLIGVDNDWSIGYPEWSAYVLASALKNMDMFVYNIIESELNGEFEGGDFVGTLENDGVGIAVGPDFADKVPQELLDEIEGLRQQIIDGTISAVPAAAE